MTAATMTTRNPILDTDSYKLSHFLQYPPGTTEVSAYIEARAGARFPEITFFGLQMFLKGKLAQPVTVADVDEAEAFTAAHIPGLAFNRAGWDIVVGEHGGRLPIEIEALPEGMSVPVGTPLVQLRNTDPRLPWLTTYVETALLRGVWYPSTVASLSRQAKKIILAGLERSCDAPHEQIAFRLHDFGARGCTSEEQAGLGGAAHLVNFLGTDTIEGVLYARRFYGGGLAGFSIPAAEHSTMTSWGKSREADAYRHMLTTFGGEGKIVAVVSDSYDIFSAVRNLWCGTLKGDVTSTGGTVVIRPDSGDPVETPIAVLRTLDAAFGSTRNKKGFRVLNPAVRVIQGDGMTLDTIETLVRKVVDAGFSVENIAVGMGGGLLQKVDRDTMRFAMKANEIIAGGERRPVSKAPVGDAGKASRAGRLKVVRGAEGAVSTLPEGEASSGVPLMQPVWRNGELLRDFSFDEVRANAAA